MGSRFYNVMRASGYRAPETFEEAKMGFTKSGMQFAIGQVTIKQFDGGDVEVDPSQIALNSNPGFNVGESRETWTLHNSLLTSAKI
jgi:hypothetical protein